MDSGSQASVGGGRRRSGGKILKQRPIAVRKTPYIRPTRSLQSENSNWLNAFVIPAKFVAGGAGKLISSVWNPKSWGSHSSSSESDSDSEGGIEDIHDAGANKLTQNQSSSSGKSEILYLVEQLLMLERFSREEYDRLIKIINLRVGDHTRREGVDAEPNNPNISSKMIMEARKKITENQVGSSVNSDLASSIHGSKSLVTTTRYYRGSWNIQKEMQQLHSKAVELRKPTLKHGNETVNMNSKDMRTNQDDAPTEALSSLPTTKKKYQIADDKSFKGDKSSDDVNSDMITEYVEAADVINASQASSNTHAPTSTNKTDSPTVKRAATRTRKHNSRRGRPRGK